MIYERVQIVLVWQRPNDGIRACIWLHSGTLSDIAAAQTYAATDGADGDMAVYTFARTFPASHSPDVLSIAKSQYQACRQAIHA